MKTYALIFGTISLLAAIILLLVRGIDAQTNFLFILGIMNLLSSKISDLEGKIEKLEKKLDDAEANEEKE